MLIITSAPWLACKAIGPEGNQQSSQTEMPDPHTRDLEDRAQMAGLEVALLVEHAVVRQEHLAIHGLQLAVVQEGRRVEDVTLFVDEADDGRDTACRPGDHVQLGEVVPHKCRFQDEVFGRVSGDRELREAHDVGAQVTSAADPVDDQPGVAVQVAHDRVDLRQRDPQGLGHRFNSDLGRN